MSALDPMPSCSASGITLFTPVFPNPLVFLSSGSSCQHWKVSHLKKPLLGPTSLFLYYAIALLSSPPLTLHLTETGLPFQSLDQIAPALVASNLHAPNQMGTVLSLFCLIIPPWHTFLRVEWHQIFLFPVRYRFILPFIVSFQCLSLIFMPSLHLLYVFFLRNPLHSYGFSFHVRTTRTDCYLMCGARYKMHMWGPSFNYY